MNELLIVFLTLFCILGLPIILNPILYFIYFEIYKRKTWIQKFNRRPTIDDVMIYMTKDDDFELCYFPIVGLFMSIIFIAILIFKPFCLLWNKIKNIKV